MAGAALNIGASVSSSYNVALVALSIVIASAAAYTALTLAERVTVAQGRIRVVWLLCGAVAMGSGIWSMHFTGMMAFQLPIPVSYDIPLVVLSLLVAIVASGVVLVIVAQGNLPMQRWLGGGLLLGAAIGAMHYIGMAAMSMDAMAHWDYHRVGLSLCIAIAVSLVALKLVFQLRTVAAPYGEWRRLAAAAVMGMAIAGMHYAGMAAAHFSYMPMPLSTAHAISARVLGDGAITLFSVLVLALALSIAFIDRRFSAQEQALAESKQHFQMVMANAPVILLALDARGVITLAQGRGLAALGYSASELTGKSFFECYHDEPAFVQQAQRALVGEEHLAQCAVRELVLETRWTPVRNDRGQMSGAIAVATDITERHRAEVALEHRALHDGLTDLPNRTLLEDRLTHDLRHAAATGSAVSLVFMDLNRFKDINDTLGHHVGDVVLTQIGARMRRVLRASDLVARHGGDEFAVILPGTDATAATLLVQQLLAEITRPLLAEEGPIEVGASLGIAVYPEHGIDAPTLMRRADVAMYVAKRLGTNYALYDPVHDQYSATRFTLARDLRQAVANGSLELYYQPKVDPVTNQLCGVEALARWFHPEQGQITPDRFIPVAEQTGIIVPLTQWVLDTALRQCGRWQQAGLYLPVAVNLSARNLHDASLLTMVADLLREHQVAPSWLTLEITESAIMEDPSGALLLLTQLSDLGVQLEVDDFGTGYSSLSYLKRLPVDGLKVDRSFVQHLVDDANDAAIVTAIIGLAHSLGLHVVAEGVEDQEALQRLVALGCDIAQGYYFSRPLPAAEIERWIAASSNPDAATQPVSIAMR